MRNYRNYKYNKANISNFIIEGKFDSMEPWEKRWADPEWDYDSHNNNPIIECLTSSTDTSNTSIATSTTNGIALIILY